MTVLRRQLQILWAIAILLVGATQLAQARADLICHSPCETEHQDHTEGSPDCPFEHSCCHGHAQTFFASLDESCSLVVTSTTRSLPHRNQRPVEGPTLEIDHPPQLS